MRMTFTFYVCLSLKTESWTLGWTFQPLPPTNRPSILRIFLNFLGFMLLEFWQLDFLLSYSAV